jgi:aminoglycoside 6'-N-acetyltransferase I
LPEIGTSRTVSIARPPFDAEAIEMIFPCTSTGQSGWLALRQALWPDCPAVEHLAEMQLFVAHPDKYAQFVAYEGDGQPAGLAEVALRTDYVNGTSGTDGSPVAFLEGLYVAPAYRRRGVARALLGVVADWALAHGCIELASDALLENTASHAMHAALGFEETERVVFFCKPLVPAQACGG